MGSALARAWTPVAHALAVMWAATREAAPLALHVGCILVGWGSLAHGLAVWTARPDVVWPLAIGIFLLSIAGWGHLRVIAAAGIYALRRRALGE